MNESTMSATEPVDTRDMIVVHTALLREIRLAPAAVERAGCSSRRRRVRTARHLGLVLAMLEHHHAGEDRLMLPLLRARVPDVQAVDTGEQQHAHIESILAATTTTLGRWVDGERGSAAALAGLLIDLYAALEPHLRGEERDVLPLAAVHLSPAEWQAIGEAGSHSVPKRELATVFGMFMYEGDPAVLRAMLAHAPAPVRMVIPRVAPGAYARRSRAVHGTARP